MVVVLVSPQDSVPAAALRVRVKSVQGPEQVSVRPPPEGTAGQQGRGRDSSSGKDVWETGARATSSSLEVQGLGHQREPQACSLPREGRMQKDAHVQARTAEMTRLILSPL